MDASAVKTTSPLALNTQPVASTIGAGGVVLGLVEIFVLEFLSISGLRVTQSTCTASGVRMSLGLGGKPPRPVMMKLL